MKLKLNQIADSIEAIKRIGAEKMPIKTAWDIQRNTRLITPEFNAWDEKRAELIKNKYGAKDEKGNFLVTRNNMKVFQEEMKILGDCEVELDIQSILMDDFKADISPADLMALEWMFKK
jgi:hypothetical protein